MSKEDLLNPLFKVVEIFESISGEINGYNNAGQLSTFIRLHGCNLQCPFCDTPESRDGPFELVSLEDIVKRTRLRHVVLTGGEPLIHPLKDIEFLILALQHEGIDITIETNGTIVPPFRITSPCQGPIRECLRYVMDYKPDSCYPPNMLKSGLQFYQPYQVLNGFDVVKFLIETDDDYEHMIGILPSFNSLPQIAISPVLEAYHLDPIFCKHLIERLVEDSLPSGPLFCRNVHFSIQVHKLLGVK